MNKLHAVHLLSFYVYFIEGRSELVYVRKVQKLVNGRSFQTLIFQLKFPDADHLITSIKLFPVLTFVLV